MFKDFVNEVVKIQLLTKGGEWENKISQKTQVNAFKSVPAKASFLDGWVSLEGDRTCSQFLPQNHTSSHRLFRDCTTVIAKTERFIVSSISQ